MKTLWWRIGQQNIYRRYFYASLQSLVTFRVGLLMHKTKSALTLVAVHGGNRWEFHCLINSVSSAGTLSLEAVFWGCLPFAPWKFLTGVFMMAANCLLFTSPCSLVFHFCFPNVRKGKAFYCLHISGKIVFTQILSHTLIWRAQSMVCPCTGCHLLPGGTAQEAAALGLYHSTAAPGVRCCLSWLVYVHTGTASRAKHKPRDPHVVPLCQWHCALAASSPLV